MIMFNELWITLQLILDIMMLHLADAAQVMAFVSQTRQGQPRTDMQIYLIGLRRLAIIAVLSPIPILILGILGDWSLLLTIVAGLWIIFTLLLAILAGPIGILLEAINKDIDGSGKRYTNIVLGVLLVELVFTLFIRVVPISENPGILPIAILAAAILGVLAVLNSNYNKAKKTIGAVAKFVLIVCILAFFFPPIIDCFKNWRGKINAKIAKICSPTFCQNPAEQTGQKSCAITVYPGVYTFPPPIPYGYGYKINPGGKIGLVSPQIGSVQMGPNLPEINLGKIDLAKTRLISLKNQPVRVEFTYWSVPTRPAM